MGLTTFSGVGEADRLAALRRYGVLDTPSEPAFDRIVRMTALLLDVPMALVSLVDSDRQWFKAAYGLDVPQTPRCVAFCDHTIRGLDLLIVPDAQNDDRFSGNPLVTGAPNLRFYAGAPLITRDGYALGTLCALDRRPRRLDDREKEVLTELAAQVMHELEVRTALGGLYEQIDQTQQAKRSLRSNNLQLAALLNITNTAVVAADREGRITAWSKAAQDIFGYDSIEIDGQPISTLLSEPYRASESPFLSFEQARRPRDPQRLHGRHQDGHEFPIEASLASWDDPFSLNTFGAIIRDFTARSAAEEELKHSRAHLADAQKIAGLGSWDWRLDEGRISLSDEMSALLEIAPGIDLSVDDLLARIHPDDQAAFRQQTLEVGEGDEPSPLTFRVRCDDGATRILRGTARLAPGWDGRSTRMIGIAQDITLQTRLEAAEREGEKLTALGELAGGVAHELNNLLQPVISLTELASDRIREGTPSPEELSEMDEHFGLILEYGRQAREIVRKILKFARQEASTLTVMDFGQEVRASSLFLRDLVPPDVRITIEIMDDAEGEAQINATELTQIMTNLVVNAAHAMEGHGQVTLSLARIGLAGDEAAALSLPDGAYFRLAVADTGWGMSEATKARIFEPFFTTKPVGIGTGLGLSLVHGILHSWQGAIAVSSELGRGTCFSLFIPVHH